MSHQPHLQNFKNNRSYQDSSEHFSVWSGHHITLACRHCKEASADMQCNFQSSFCSQNTNPCCSRLLKSKQHDGKRYAGVHGHSRTKPPIAKTASRNRCCKPQTGCTVPRVHLTPHYPCFHKRFLRESQGKRACVCSGGLLCHRKSGRLMFLNTDQHADYMISILQDLTTA